MVSTKLLRVLIVVILTLALFGCGETGNTNGTLTLIASAPLSGVGTADLSASATVTPARTGTDVTITVNQFGYDASSGVYTTIETFTETKSTDDKGFVRFTAHSFTQSQSMATSLQVTAVCQGLQDTKNIPVAKFVP